MDRCLEIQFNLKPRIVPLDGIIAELPHIRIQDGYTIQCVVPGGSGQSYDGSSCILFALRSFIYARPVDMPQIDSTVLYNYPAVSYDSLSDIYSPLEKIAIPEKASKEFIWEAYLISRMPVDMPLFGHAEVGKEILLSTCPWFLDKLKKQEFGPYMNAEHETCDHIEAVMSNSDCGPRCINYSENKRITYWYWTDWGGLEARSTAYDLTDDSISFSEQSDITIVHYNCMVMF